MSQPPPDDLVATAWADTRTCFRIPAHYAEQLVDGVARDLRQTRYATFADLATYTYGVASAAAGDLYRAILRDIEVHDYDVFHHRAHVSPWGKLYRLPGIWWHLPRTRNDHDTL